MKFRRLLSFVLAVLLVGNLAAPALAATVGEPVAFTVTADKTSYETGDTVKLTVSQSEEVTGLGLWDVTVYFDHTALQLNEESCENKTGRSSIVITEKVTNAGAHQVSALDTDTSFGSGFAIPAGEVLVLTFTALKEGTTAATCLVTMADSLFDNEYNSNNGDITVPETVEIVIADPVTQYTVTLPQNPVGYSIETEDPTTLTPGSTFTFAVEVAEGYEGTPVVKAGGETLTPNEDGMYTITVTADIAIEVSGITRYFEGYAVKLSEDKTISAGEMAEVKIPVMAESAQVYNAYDMTVSYDADIVKFESCVASNAEDKLTVEAAAGSVRIMGYGPDKAVGESPVALTFSGKAVGAANVTVTTAKVDIGEHAVSGDAPEATVADDGTAVITVTGYVVTLGEGLRADTLMAQNGVDYTFYPTDADNYNYAVTATIGNETFTVGANGDGSYTIPGDRITGNITVTAVLTAKEYAVIFIGEDASGNGTATYNTNYIFTLNKQNGYTYSLSVKIGDKEYTGFTDNKDGTYTIPGTDITGTIVVTVTKTALADDKVNVNMPGYVVGEDTATKGKDYTFSIPEEEGFIYGDVTVTVDGVDISDKILRNDDGSYTIPAAYMTGTVEIQVARISDLASEVVPYITLDDGWVMYLVSADIGDMAQSHAVKYDGKRMYWSEQYNKFAWLVISNETLEAVKAQADALISVASGADYERVDYSGDVNGTAVIDINDAQLTYDMYNARYADFTEVTMLKFLNADINGDATVNVEDAAAVVAVIP